MRNQAKYLLVIFSILFLSSCASIEKRRYMDGYHVAWSSKKEVVESKNADEMENNLSAPFDKEESLVAVNDSIQPVVIAENNGFPESWTFISDTLPKKGKGRKNDGPQKFDEAKDVTKQQRKTPGIAVIGMVLGVVTFACSVWLILSALYGIFIIGIIAAITGFGLSLAALQRIKKNESLEGRAMATAGIILSLTFIAALLCLIAYALAGLPSI